MTTFQDRLATGVAFEQKVAAKMGPFGWEVTPWGQGILPYLTRRAISDSRLPFRYNPDLIASRPGEIVAIDAKDHMQSTETGRYAVSRECVLFGVQFYAAFGVPLYYVFGNFGVLCPTEIISYGRIGPRSTGGAYYLVNGALAHDFDEIFGASGSSAAA